MSDVQVDLGSDASSGTYQFSLFVPSVDREGQPVDQRSWVDEALTTFATQFGGATAFPGRGAWRDDERGGKLVFDDTVIVTCYADPAAVTGASMAIVRAFVHRLGREARQGEVGIVIDGTFHSVRRFDAAEPGA